MDKRKTKGSVKKELDKQQEILKQVEEMNEREKQKKRAIILILSIFTILLALVGASFAYFTSIVKDIKGTQSFAISATEIEGLTYKSSDALKLTEAYPGDSAEDTITVTNPNAAAKIRYSMKLVSDVNNFTTESGPEQLVVTVSGGDLKAPVTLDFTDGDNVKEQVVFSAMDLNPKESDVFRITMEFRDTGTNQDTNQNKTFVGHIEITQSIVLSQD